MCLSLGALVVGMALLVAGCGSGGDSTTTLTHNLYIRQGNAICEKQSKARQAKLEAVAKKAGKSKVVSEPEKVKLMLEFIASYEEEVSELKALGTPPQNEDRVNKMIEEMEKAASKGRENPKVVIKSAAYFDNANELAREYGLENCGL